MRTRDMNPTVFKSGFSLTEVLMAAGILLVGFLLIAGTFPVGVKLTAVATERTIGAIVSEEALAKIHLYGIDDPTLLPYDRHVPYDGVSVAQYRQRPVATRSEFISPTAYTQLKIKYPGIDTLDGANTFPAFTKYFQFESLYPSTAYFDYSVPTALKIKADPADPQRYFWAALCRRLDQTSTEIQVTIFVSRMAGQGAKYPQFNYSRVNGIDLVPPISDTWEASNYPTPVPVQIQTVVGSQIGIQAGARWTYYFQKLSVTPAELAKAAYISKGAILLDDSNGRLMRVLDVRLPDPGAPTDLGEITLFRPLDSDNNPATVVPSDGDGMLLVQVTNPVANAIYYRWIWVVPPAMAATASGVPSSTPPKVIGRNPCVGVFQGQL